jgi:RNA polymerase sigma factor (sigma-70 family)
MGHERQLSDPAPAVRAFEQFYNNNYTAISNYVARRVPQDSHDDVVAATFIVAWHKYAKVSDPSLPWLYRIAEFEVAHERRRIARHGVVELHEDEIGEVEEPSHGFDLQAALRQLPEDDAELIRLVHWDRLSRSEVASLLNCSVNTLNVRYHRAIERLSGTLHRQFNSDDAAKVRFRGETQ